MPQILADIKAGNPDAALARLDALQDGGHRLADDIAILSHRIAASYLAEGMDAQAFQLHGGISDPRRAATGLGCGLCRLSPGPLGRCRPASGKAGAEWRRRRTAARPRRFLGGARPYAVGDPQKVVSLLAAAAKEEPTFYGLIAERMLGMDTNTGFSDAVLTQADFNDLMAVPPARRAVAL